MPRVVAFLVCGVALLVIAALRGRRSSSAEVAPGPALSPDAENRAAVTPSVAEPEQQRPDGIQRPPQLD